MGLITIVVGILVMMFLPDNPMSSRLTRDEKIWAIERLRENQTGIENKHFKLKQALECLKDPHTWLLSLITIAIDVPNGAISSYQATIIKGYAASYHSTFSADNVLDSATPPNKRPYFQSPLAPSRSSASLAPLTALAATTNVPSSSSASSFRALLAVPSWPSSQGNPIKANS